MFGMKPRNVGVQRARIRVDTTKISAQVSLRSEHWAPSVTYGCGHSFPKRVTLVAVTSGVTHFPHPGVESCEISVRFWGLNTAVDHCSRTQGLRRSKVRLPDLPNMEPLEFQDRGGGGAAEQCIGSTCGFSWFCGGYWTFGPLTLRFSRRDFHRIFFFSSKSGNFRKMNTFRRDCHEGHVDGGMMASYPAKLANPTVQQAGSHSYCCDSFEVYICLHKIHKPAPGNLGTISLLWLAACWGLGAPGHVWRGKDMKRLKSQGPVVGTFGTSFTLW